LIAIAQKLDSPKGQIKIRGAVVNNNAIYNNRVSTGITEYYDNMQLETVHYIIIEKAAANLTTGDRAVYSLGGHARGNFVFWPKAFDSMANSLYGSSRPKLGNERPARLQNHSYNPMNIIKDGLNNIPKFISSLLSGETAWSSMVGPALSMASGLLLCEKDPKNDV
jgi:hypothetical protein